MSRIYKSARGRMVDMDKIKIAQETAIAVGNMKVNARGDKIGPGGEITKKRNAIMDEAYAVDAFPPYSPNDPSTFKQQQDSIQAVKAKELNELANNLVPTVPTQEAVIAPAPTAPARGSLAGSVAKTVAVNQEPAPNPKEQKKANGPVRI